MTDSVQPGAYVVGLRVVEHVEDDVGGLPGVEGRLLVPGCELDVAEPGQRGGLAVPVALAAEESGRAVVALDRLVVLAELVVGVPDAVPGRRLAVPVALLLDDRERLAAVGQRRQRLADQSMVAADVVERGGPAGVVADRREVVVGPLGVSDRLGEVALYLCLPAEDEVGAGEAVVVAQAAVQVERLLEMVASLVITESGVRVGERTVRVRPGRTRRPVARRPRARSGGSPPGRASDLAGRDTSSGSTTVAMRGHRGRPRQPA